MLCVDWKFAILTNLLISSLCSPNCRFEFPKLKDSSRLTSDGNHTIVVEFRAHRSCNASSDNRAYSVGKEVNGDAKQHCLILPVKVQCVGKCTCPTEGSDLYRLELAAEQENNGTWTWFAIPSSAMEKHSMQILIEGDWHSTEPKTGSTPTSADERTSVDDGNADDTFVTNVKHPNDGFSFAAKVAVGVSVTAVIFVSVILTVICRLRYNLKAIAHRQPRITVRDLYRGSNVSMMVSNELYEGSQNLLDNGACALVSDGANDSRRSSLEEGDYAEIDSFLRQSVAVSDRPNCRPPPVDYVPAAEVRRNKRDLKMFA
ncbi:uncharacterized protein [Littorina saxatilis]|uniref:uncharacterized protein n=1 Tax=Littorina saxatilis TaxID=31220 RepID=UPI0038B5C8A9